MHPTDNKTLICRDIYNDYVKTYPKIAVKLDYKTYHKIILELNKAAQDLLLEGGTLELGHSLGKMDILRFQRKFAVTSTGSPKLPVDWGETRKMWAADPVTKALKKRVFFTNPFYIGVCWRRKYCNIKGKMSYGFDSSRTGQNSDLGFKNRLVKKLRENPLASESYPLTTRKHKDK